MSRRRLIVGGMFAVAFAMMLALPSNALAAYTNPDCVSCHSSTIGAADAQHFDVGAVDFTKACKKCHDDSLAGTHPYHNPTSNCGSSCHPGWGASLVSAVPNYTDIRGYGVFAGKNSADTSASILHIIHSRPRWMESKSFSFSKCGSCHAVATCDSCHDNPPAPDPVTHASHASTPPLSPWMGNTSSGVPNGDQTVSTYVLNNAIRCGAIGCHNTAGVANSTPGLLDDKSHVANAAFGYLANTVTKTPPTAWRVMYSNVYTLGQISQSNTTNSTLAVPFTGEQFILVADKDPYRGIAEILVDGVSQGTVDLYKETTANQVEVFKSAVLTGGPSRIITVRVTGTKNPLARAAYVRVDQFKVFSNAPGKVAPNCTSCHPGKAGTHGLGNFSHEATGSAAATFSGKRCDSCHSMPMTTEHARVSSASAATGCSACHDAYAPKTMTPAWNTTCAYGTCHVAERTPHTAMAAGHTPTSDAAEASCRGCHPGDLAVIHNNSITSNWVESTCNSCHTPTKFPATKSCVDSTCHGGAVNGTISVEKHDFGETTHTAIPMTSAYQGASPAVSNGGKDCSVCHSAQLDTAHTGVTGGTVSCTTGGVGGTGCHDNTSLNGRAVASAGWSTSKCSECHNSGTKTSHDSTVTPHAAAAVGCAGTIAGCHTSTDLWELHAKGYSGGTPKGDSCSNTGCHDPGNLNKRPSLKTCGTGNACHQGKTTSNHGKQHALTIASSTYADGSGQGVEAGCLTSGGGGCHDSLGAGNTSVDIGDYHQTTQCATSACHMSGDKPTHTEPFICGDCHDSTYDRAVDTTALADLSPTGHYIAASHTATNGIAAVDTGGDASETCSVCHDMSLKDAHDGIDSQTMDTKVTCGECHNYPNVTAQVKVFKWSNGACSDCHNSTVILSRMQHANSLAVPVAATVSVGCSASDLNCHNTNDLHSIHKNADDGCDLSGCHDPSNKNIRPTKKSCGTAGTCHTTYNTNTTFGTHTKSDETTDHAPTLGNTAQQSATFQGVACGSCHIVARVDGGLIAEHSAATASQTVVPGNVCRNCHNHPSADVASTIATEWGAPNYFKNTPGGCTGCHFSAGLQMHATQNTAAHSDVVSTGCSSSGIGCHNSSDLSQVGLTNVVNTNIHTSCLRCHDRTASGQNLAWNPANDTCGSGRECHAAGTQYNTSTSVHNGGGGLADGDDATHHTATGMTGTVGGYANKNTCATCHAGTLATAHVTSLTGWTNTCTSCHNSPLAGTVSADQVKAGWTNNVCGDCHVAGTSVDQIPNMHDKYTLVTHTTLVGASTADANDADGCVSGGCHLAGATDDVRLIHDRASSGCSASGQDSLSGNGGANAACHALNKAMVAGTIGCGKANAGGTKCHVNHTNTNHGISNGGQTCYKCHTVYKDSMNTTGAAAATTVHHVMGTAVKSGDATFAAGAYPNTRDDVYCLSCHTDHNYFNGAASKAGNLRRSAVTASGATTEATDFVAGGTGVCVSCHDTSLTKEGMGTKQLNIGTTATPIIAGADFNTSAHQYSVPSSFGASATFNANCSKCHSDEQTKQYSTGVYKFGTHYSASAGILGALGAFVGNPPQEEACYKCHITAAGSGTDLKTVAARDAYNARSMSTTSEATFAEFALASKHNLAKVACANCHNVHEATSAVPVANPDDTYAPDSVATTASANNFCLKCHDGILPTQTVSGLKLIPYTVSANATANVATNYTASGHGSLGAASVDCRDCHEQHGSSLVHLLKTSVDGQAVASYTDTADQRQCLACHRTGGIAGAANIARYYPTTVGGAATQSGTFPLGTRFGHRIKTAGGTLAADSAMPCRSCHNPHGGSGSGYMLAVRTQLASGVDTMVGDAVGELRMSDASQTPAAVVNTRRFCFTCHTTSDAGNSQGWNGTSMAVVPPGAKVLGIERASASVLKLPPLANSVKGHALADTYSCYLCHGDDFSASNSVNVHNPAAGESRGGIPCYICHTVYQDKMEDGLGSALGLARTTSYHHVLGNGTTRQGDTTITPTLGTDGRDTVYCLSCHVDHDKFSPLVNAGNSRSKNLRSAYDNAAVTSASADWNATTGGVCLGCHTTSLVRDNTNQKPEAASSVTASFTSAAYDASPHQYSATSTFTDGKIFNAECVKCHDSEIDGGGMERGSGVAGFQTSPNKFSSHYSSARRLLGAMGVTVTDPPAEEAVCYRCHSLSTDGLKVTANRDWYSIATMDATSQAIFGRRTSTYSHNVDGYSGIHRTNSVDESQTYISNNKHVECGDCHDVHAAQTGQHTRTSSSATNNNVSGAITGVPGVQPVYTANSNWAVATSYTATSSATKEYQICFKCHSKANANVTTWGGAGAASWTDVGLDFNPNNGSYHPVVAALPATDPDNAASTISYGSSRLRGTNMRGAGTVSGYSVGGFGVGGTMYCSDCHMSDDSASLGPHGSSVKWMLKGPNQAWPYTTRAANGTNATTDFRLHSSIQAGVADGPDGIFCNNCHVLNTVGRSHGTFDKHGTMACVSCHVRVPHGSKTTRLLATVGNVAYPGNMPLRMTSNGAGTLAGTTYLKSVNKPAAGSDFAEGDCSTNDCGTHGTGLVTSADATW